MSMIKRSPRARKNLLNKIVSTYVDQKTYKTLSKISEKDDVSRSQILRLALEAYLANVGENV